MHEWEQAQLDRWQALREAAPGVEFYVHSQRVPPIKGWEKGTRLAVIEHRSRSTVCERGDGRRFSLTYRNSKHLLMVPEPIEPDSPRELASQKRIGKDIARVFGQLGVSFR